MELWDLYDRKRALTGRTIERGQPVPRGTYFMAVAVWVVNRNNELLLTLRAKAKESWPGYWENTGGAAQAGETSREAAVRELREETGIAVRPQEPVLLGTSWRTGGFMDVYAVRRDCPLEEIRLQEGETEDAQWVSLERLDEMVSQRLVAMPIAHRLREFRRELEGFIAGETDTE